MMMIGLGGGSMLKYLHRHLPEADLTAVEINPGVIELRDDALLRQLLLQLGELRAEVLGLGLGPSVDSFFFPDIFLNGAQRRRNAEL